MLKAYLDTCIVSALVRNDITPEEMEALDELFTLYKREMVELVCSKHVKEEIDDIPPEHREPHAETLNQFLSMPSATVGGLTRMGPAGYGVGNPRFTQFERLKKILRDEVDRRHVFAASCNRIRYLVTIDRSTMLSKRDEVLAAIGVQLMLPSEFLQLMRSAEEA